MNHYFNILNSFVGFGNPNGRFWFIGLEEAGKWVPDTIDKEIEKYKERFLADPPGTINKDSEKYGARYTKLYDIMSKIIIVAKQGALRDWKNYRDSELLLEGGETFQANLFPLGKASLKTWPPHYGQLFNLHSLETYLAHVRDSSGRFPMLYSEWLKRFRLEGVYSSSLPLITICFGMAEWETFASEWHLGNSDCENNVWYRVYATKRLILCPFFSYRRYCMPSSRIEVIGKEVARLLAY